MRKLFFLFLFVSGYCVVSAQQTVIKGKIADTLEQKVLPNAVICLIKKSDSTLYKFVRTNKNGEFTFVNVDTGKYIVLITYPKFADFSDEFVIKNQPENNLGTIPLTLKSRLLDAVVIRSAGAIRIK